MRRIAVALLATVLSAAVSAQSVIGRWKTIDDETGKARSVVEIYERGGKVYGKIIKLFREPSEDQNPSCSKCTDDRKGKKVLGMEIIRSLVKNGRYYEDGTILDPKTGKIYDCKIWVEDGKLQVRGYIAFLFRTQTWVPYKE